MGVLQRLSSFGSEVVEELQQVSGNPEPKSVDSLVRSVRSDNVEKHYPDKKSLERYWELYKGVPIIRNPIRSFASEVVSPGYYVDTENEDAKEELESWLEDSSIVDGEVDKDFRRLLKKATIQREVKGTSVVEKVYTDQEELYGFKLMRPETVRAYTYPGQTLLLPPDAEVSEEENSPLMPEDDFVRTTDNEVAAFVQFEIGRGRFGDGDSDSYVAFTRDQILKLTRDADTGEVFGISRVHAVEDRLESLRKKLDDNDKAIESVAHPSLIYQLGTDENPFEPDKVRNFADAHKQEQYEPGLKQFLQGNIDVEEVSGEVADIVEYLNWDLNYIISDMPMPKYSLGAYESDVNQFVSRSQSARLERQLKDARQEIQDEWTPVVKEKAEELGYDPEEIDGLVIGEEAGEFGLIPEDDVQEGNIPDANNSDETNVGEDGTNYTRPPASTEPNRDGGGETA